MQERNAYRLDNSISFKHGQAQVEDLLATD